MIDAPVMKAVVFDRYGGPERLSLCHVPIPEPKPGEVRVRVQASTVSRTDTATLAAHPFFARAMTGLLRPNMSTLGMDFAGEVEALGAGVSGFQTGDRVFGLSPDRFGAHAEYLCVRADGAIAPIPEHLDFAQAVVCEGAWYASSTTRLLSQGQRCLIYGASGAIGTAAVQLAKLQGAEVTAVVGRRHLDLAERLGADIILDYETEDFTAIGQTFDLVLDAVGKTSWFACRPLLGQDGIFAATDLGPGWSNIVLAAWFSITRSGRVRIPYPDDAPGFVRRLAGHMAAGNFRGTFDRRYTLDEISAAFRYVAAGQKTGIVVVDIAGQNTAGVAP